WRGDQTSPSILASTAPRPKQAEAKRTFSGAVPPCILGFTGRPNRLASGAAWSSASGTYWKCRNPRARREGSESSGCSLRPLPFFSDSQSRSILAASYLLVILGPTYTTYSAWLARIGQEKWIRICCVFTLPCHGQNKRSPSAVGCRKVS